MNLLRIVPRTTKVSFRRLIMSNRQATDLDTLRTKQGRGAYLLTRVSRAIYVRAPTRFKRGERGMSYGGVNV